MRSIKPGRGSSLQGAIGSLFAVVFGIVWMVSAAKSGAPTPFVLMGLVFVVIAGSNVIISLMNATGENRFSLYDITEEGEEPDPLEEMLNKKEKQQRKKRKKRDQQKRLFVLIVGQKRRKTTLSAVPAGKSYEKKWGFLPFFSRMYLYTLRFLFIINMLSVLLKADFETVYISGNFVFLGRKKSILPVKKTTVNLSI